jgi:hypothetical protein
VVGEGRVRSEEVSLEGEVVFEGEVKLEQEVEGKAVCVGLIHLLICWQKVYEAIPEGATKQLRTEVSQV